MKIKPIVAYLLSLLLLLSGCASPGEPSPVTLEPTRGRYMEDPIALSIPGYTDLSVHSINAVEDKAEYYTLANSEATGKMTFLTITMSPDGAFTYEEEAWLDEYIDVIANNLLICRGPDGTKYAAWGDFDGTGGIYARVILTRDGGKTATELTGSGISSLSMATHIEGLQGGGLVVSDWENDSLFLLDQDGNLVTELPAKRGASIAVFGEQLATFAPNLNAVRVYDLNSNTHADWEFTGVMEDSQLTYGGDGALYLVSSGGIYRHTLDGTLWEQIVDGSVTNLGLPAFYPGTICALEGEHPVLFVSGYSMSDGSQILRYAFDPTASQTANIELNVFSLTDNKLVRQAIVAFHRQRSDVKINYTVAMDQNATGTKEDYIKALNTELLAGTGPDMMLLDGFPVNSYIEKAVLTDLTDILSGAEELLPNLASAFSTDGKLYCIPISIGVPLALARNGQSFDTLSDFAKNVGAISKVTYTPDKLSQMLFSYYGEALTPDAGAVEVFLQDAKTIADACNATSNTPTSLMAAWNLPGGIVPEMEFAKDTYSLQLFSYKDKNADAIVCENYAISDGTFFLTANLMQDFGGNLMGIGSKFIPKGLMGINRAGKYQEAAAAFLQTLLSQEVQGANAYNFGYPVNRAALGEVMRFENDSISMGGSLDGEDYYEGVWPKIESREKLQDILLSATAPILADDALAAMVTPVIAQYIEGAIDLSTATQTITSKLTAYLSE